MNSNTTVTFTKYTDKDKKPVNKDYPPTAPNTKPASRNFYIGDYEVITMNWKLEFGKFLSELKLYEIISQGTPNEAVPATSENRKGQCEPHVPNPKFKRHGSHLDWCADRWGANRNLIQLDIDRLPPGTATIEDALTHVLEDLPELDQLLASTQEGIWGYPSAGSYIYDTSTAPHTPAKDKGLLSGIHFYFLLPTEISPKLFREYVDIRLRANTSNKPYITFVKENSNTVTRVVSYIDIQAIGGERLDYIAGSLCKPPYIQQRPAPEYFEIDAHQANASANPEPTPYPDFTAVAQSLSDLASKKSAALLAPYVAQEEYQERYQAYIQDLCAKAKAKDATLSESDAKKLVRALQEGQSVSGSTILYFDPIDSNGNRIHNTSSSTTDEDPNAEQVPAWMCYLNPGHWHGRRLADPRDGKRRPNKAQFWASCPSKYLDQATITHPDRPPIPAGTPVIHGYKGGEAIMQIEIDLSAIWTLMSNQNYDKDKIKALYGDTFYSLLDQQAGLGADEIEEVKEVIANKWHQTYKTTDKMIKEAATSASSSKAKQSSKAIRDLLVEYDQKYSILKQGDSICAIFEESNPDFPGTLITTQLSRVVFMDWARKTVYLNDSKGNAKATNLADLWWEQDHKIKYSGTTFRPDSTQKTITTLRTLTPAEIAQGYPTPEPEYHLNMHKGPSLPPLAPGERPCQGQHCDQLGCLSYFINTKLQSLAEAFAHPPDESEWKNWGCPHIKSSSTSSSCLWYFRSMFENICKAKPRLFNWGLDWIADMFQHPATKPGTAFVMQGGQGTGKGLLVAPLSRIYAKHYYHAQSSREITGQFNLHLDNLILLYADEASWGGDRKESGAWKAFITEKIKGIEGKGKEIKKTINYARMMISSNAQWVTPTESDDRRHFILEVSNRFQNKPLLTGQGQFDAYWRQVARISDSALLWELLNHKITSNLRTAPVTAGLISQKIQSMTIEEQFIDWIVKTRPPQLQAPITNNDFADLISEVKGINYSMVHFKPKSVVTGIANKLIPECGKRHRSMGKRKERGVYLNLDKVEEWFIEKFSIASLPESEQDEVDQEKRDNNED